MAAHDYSQPDALEGEPVFWQDSASDEPGFYPDEAPCDDGHHADAEVDRGQRREYHKRPFKRPKLESRGGGALRGKLRGSYCNWFKEDRFAHNRSFQ